MQNPYAPPATSKNVPLKTRLASYLVANHGLIPAFGVATISVVFTILELNSGLNAIELARTGDGPIICFFSPWYVIGSGMIRSVTLGLVTGCVISKLARIGGGYTKTVDSQNGL